MARNNYDHALLEARQRFLTYSQTEILSHFSLENDENYLYLPFIGQCHRIHRDTGLVEWLDRAGLPHEAGFEASLSLYDVLCCARQDCTLSGQYAPINSVAKNYHTRNLGGTIFDRCPAVFAEHPALLDKALLALGGVREGKGDLAYRIDIFPFLPVRVQFWAADEDFPATLQILWDLNTLQYLHYETTYYVAGHLFRRLQELMNG